MYSSSDKKSHHIDKNNGPIEDNFCLSQNDIITYHGESHLHFHSDFNISYLDIVNTACIIICLTTSLF